MRRVHPIDNRPLIDVIADILLEQLDATMVAETTDAPVAEAPPVKRGPKATTKRATRRPAPASTARPEPVTEAVDEVCPECTLGYHDACVKHDAAPGPCECVCPA
jgi:hypothetical protein